MKPVSHSQRPPATDMEGVMLTYEQKLDQNLRWALNEGGKHFENQSAVHTAMRRICQRLDELGIPYAVVGGMALFAHGFRRFTEDVDIIVTREALKEIHERLEGRGYLKPFEKSKNLRDTEDGVRIEFIVSGGFPGDGKPKPVAFPRPETVSVEIDGIWYANLSTLVELKIASGMTNRDRLKDLGDVQALIKQLKLPRGLSDSLDPYVRAKYEELWSGVYEGARYLLSWRVSQPSAIATIDDLVAASPAATAQLQAMKADGVQVQPIRVDADSVYLATSDPEIAAKYDMHPEDEFLDDDEGHTA